MENLKDKKIELLEELNLLQSLLIMELDIPEICTMEVDERIHDRMNRIKKLESKIDSLNSQIAEQGEVNDWKCHCGDMSTGSMHIWACNICGMEVEPPIKQGEVTDLCTEHNFNKMGVCHCGKYNAAHNDE